MTNPTENNGTTDGAALIELRGVTKIYGTGSAAMQALRGGGYVRPAG